MQPGSFSREDSVFMPGEWKAGPWDRLFFCRIAHADGDGSCARSGVQQLPAGDAVESTARVQAAPAGKVPLCLRHPAYVGVGRSRLGYSERVEGDHAPVCVGGRGAAPPEYCGGPTGYRLMLKRQREVPQSPISHGWRLVFRCWPRPARTWDLLRTTLGDGFQSIDRRLHELGPLQPERFSLQEANGRLSKLAQRRRLRP